jgi:hypothetical protein
MTEPNFKRGDNESYIGSLVSKYGYKDIGWSNSGADFSQPLDELIGAEEIDCSLYIFRGTDIVYVNHLTREILHVDMSD